MSDLGQGARQGLIERLVGRFNLRFPTLFVLLAALTAADMIVPDCIPFVDEIGLALLTLIFGLWRQRREPPPAVDRS
jgi:hypothetical protein